MKKLESLTSADIVAQNIETLKQLFPTIVKEGQIDVEELKALLTDEAVVSGDEYYRFTWAGKAQARAEANKASTATLRPDKESSKDWDTTGNIFIEGDNLEVLKLLQKSYSNKIKMIYIDPPYNTGKDFVYRDNYKDNLANYLEQTGQLDEEGRKTSTNSESDGRYHSNWLNMMYPRLRLARNLMSEDGVIFISIDDNEQANLKKLCDEVFGEENVVGDFIITRSEGGGLAKQVIKGHDYLLVYAKNINRFEPLLRPKDIRGKIEFIDGEEYWIEEDWLRKEFGKYGTCPYNEIEKYYNIDKKQEIDEGIASNKYVLINKQGIEIVGRYRKISEDGSKFYSILKHLNKEGVKDLENLQLEQYFDYPKPKSLISELCLGTTFFQKDKGSIILDFFSGSGTTAHAVMLLNAEDGGSRKCISVQLPEPTDEKSEAYKAGYSVISDITKERIRRAGEKIKADNKDKEGIEKLDVGFKAFKLDSSNVRAWDSSKEALEQQLDLFVENNGENIKADRTEEDILFEVLLKYGLDLSIRIEKREVANTPVYNIGFGLLFICLANKITTVVAEGIGAWKEELQPDSCRVIFKDTGFSSDADKTNSMQILKRFHITEVATI